MSGFSVQFRLDSELEPPVARHSPGRGIVTEDVHSVVQQVRLAGRSLGPRLHDLSSQRLGVILTEHARAAQVPMLAECSRQSSRERHMTEPPTLGRRHLTVPVRPADACSRAVHRDGGHLPLG